MERYAELTDSKEISKVTSSCRIWLHSIQINFISFRVIDRELYHITASKVHVQPARKDASRIHEEETLWGTETLKNKDLPIGSNEIVK